ncbi:MAG: hypothetical protein IPJ19_20910 [Planctomycetes bacterium]|nr:hypothetical protein [Planctomycetota bacterium]
MRLDRLLLLPILFVAASSLRAQSFNLDVGDNLILWPVPSNGYGGAAAQTGVWNNVSHPYTIALVDLAGAPSAASCASTVSSSFNWPFGTLAGDDSALMNDIQAISSIGPAATWTFSGLANGNYAVYTYAWAPDSVNAHTAVDVPGAVEAQQIVGGSWSGSPHVQGLTYALHHVAVTSGTLVVHCAGSGGTSGSVNGFQLVQEGGSSFSSFCAGDGTAGGVACPCSNFGALGHGCENSATTGGALLSASGSTSPDLVALQSAGELPSPSSILLQGGVQLATPAVFGDGVRCIGGVLKRLYLVNAVAGVASFPPAGGPSISARSAALGDPIAPGSARYYQVYYRDPNPSFCLGGSSTYNVSSALTVNW